MDLMNQMKDERFRETFVKSAEDEFEKLIKEAKLNRAEKAKRLAYLKGVLHDIFLENR